MASGWSSQRSFALDLAKEVALAGLLATPDEFLAGVLEGREVSGFPLDRSALHIAIDMQRLFAEPTEWFMPWLDRVLPDVVAIASHAPERTLCTRFIPRKFRSR